MKASARSPSTRSAARSFFFLRRNRAHGSPRADAAGLCSPFQRRPRAVGHHPAFAQRREQRPRSPRYPERKPDDAPPLAVAAEKESKGLPRRLEEIHAPYFAEGKKSCAPLTLYSAIARWPSSEVSQSMSLVAPAWLILGCRDGLTAITL